jgi:hypothetical protein
LLESAAVGFEAEPSIFPRTVFLKLPAIGEVWIRADVDGGEQASARADVELY